MENEIKNKSLTRAELHLMNLLWGVGEATVQQLHDKLAEPKPAYTTTLTVMQVLTKKGIITFEKKGKANVYRPLLTRDAYIDSFVSETKETVFGGSIRSFLSFFAKNEKIDKDELKSILQEMMEE